MTPATPPETVVAPIPAPAPIAEPGKRAASGRLVFRLIVGAGLAASLVAGAATVRRLDGHTTHPGANSWGLSSVRVARATINSVAEASGTLESSRNVDLVSEVEGQVSILYLAPEGEIIRKGELACELDGSAFSDSLATQRIATEQAESELRTAQATLKIAEIAVREYIEGTYPQELETARNNISIAEITLRRARDTAEWSELMVGKGFLAATQHTANRLSQRSAEIGVDEAKTGLRVLDYNRRKTLITLRADVDKARTDELAKRVTHETEKAKQQKLERQLAACRIVAPRDGLVVYANQDLPPWMTQPPIMEGSTIRERQRILSLPDVTAMRVRGRLPETFATSVRPGQRARIQVAVAPGHTFHGTVAKVKPIAETGDPFFGESRHYIVLIDVDDAASLLRPAMEGQAEILLGQAEDVLAVPVGSIVETGGADYVYVVDGGNFTRREVKLGATDERVVEVREGLREGESVAQDPRAAMALAKDMPPGWMVE